MATPSTSIFKHAELKEEVERHSMKHAFYPKGTFAKNADDIFELYEKKVSGPPHNYFVEEGFRNFEWVNMCGPFLEKNAHLFTKAHWYFINSMCDNIWVIKLFEKYPDKMIPSVIGYYLSTSDNIVAIKYLEEHPYYIRGEFFCKNQNKNVPRIIEKYPDMINWSALSSNPFAIKILSDPENEDKIDWKEFSGNSAGMGMIKERFIKNRSDIDPGNLSRNINAVEFLKEHQDFISLEELCENKNENAIQLIEEIWMQYDFNLMAKANLAQNPNGIKLFEKLWKQGIISEYDITLIADILYNNESLFELDYVKMIKGRKSIIYYELIEKALSPSRVDKWLKYYIDNGGKIEDFDWI